MQSLSVARLVSLYVYNYIYIFKTDDVFSQFSGASFLIAVSEGVSLRCGKASSSAGEFLPFYPESVDFRTG